MHEKTSYCAGRPAIPVWIGCEMELIVALQKQGYNVVVYHYWQGDCACIVEGAFFKVSGGFAQTAKDAVLRAIDQVRIKEKELVH